MHVVVADDSLLFREGLCRLLRDRGFDVDGSAADVDGLMELVVAFQPSVAVCDIRMPPTGTTEGLVAARRIRHEHPEVGVLLLSHHVETHYAMSLLSGDARAVGYLLKDRVTDLADFASAVSRVGDGEVVLDPTIVTRLLERRRATTLIEELSAKERDVLRLMAEGRSNGAIAAALFMSDKTVETHVRSLFQKLGLVAAPDDHRRVLAVLAFLRA